jgi:dTDP-4-amino-4,6-dideoxygalactose transaminase
MQPFEILENEYKRYAGTEHAVTTNTGTSALHLALKALGVGKGDEVIIPEFTMIACAYAVSYCGAKPVFVDCKDDLLINERLIEKKITKKTKVIMPVHIYGRVCNMDKIMELADKYKLRVLEDCCEAQGATYKGKQVGSFDVGVFSFYWNKIIPAEEGGIITTNDENVAKRARYLKSMCFNKDHDYIHNEIGFNYRMSNLQASMALLNLTKANGIQGNRFRVESLYDKYIPESMKMPQRNVVWVYDVKHPKAEKIVKYLNEQGINARYSFKPMSQQPPYKGEYKHLKACKMSKKVFYLPVTPLMIEEQVREICQKIDKYIAVL